MSDGKRMTGQRVFSKNPIFVVIVSNEDREIKRLYYNVMFNKSASNHTQQRPYQQKVGRRRREEQARPSRYTPSMVGARYDLTRYTRLTMYFRYVHTMPLMDRCGLIFSRID